MVLVNFKNDKGEDYRGYIDENLMNNLDKIKDSVLKRGWDYVGIVSGIPGVGKSTLAQNICKYLDPTFTTKDRICFSAFGEKGLLERTSSAKLGQAFMLDESFADLNTRVTRSPEFVAIINHLQLIRQKGLYVILCLPNFFDLSKGVAIFRASHLFSVYHDRYKRGFFGAFGRKEKRKLYIKGSKYIDYNCVKPNFRGRFVKTWVAEQKLYDRLKENHLIEQFEKEDKSKISKDTKVRNDLIISLKEKGFKQTQIAEMGGISTRTIHTILKQNKEHKKLGGTSLE